MGIRTAMPLLMLLVTCGPARADGGTLCQAGGPRVAAARGALTAAPASLSARLELADALVEVSCFSDAVHTLEDGNAIHPRSAELAARLRTTRSLVSEQDYFEGREQAELAARHSRNRLRCTRLADVDACDVALRLEPDDTQILLAKARAQRQRLLERCRKEDGEGALQACQAALTAGAGDEREILARMASLRQPRNPPDAAAQAPRPQRLPAEAAQRGAPPPMVAARTYSNVAEYGRSH